MLLGFAPRGEPAIAPMQAVLGVPGAFEGVDENDSLEYLQATYGAAVPTVAELVGARATVSA